MQPLSVEFHDRFGASASRRQPRRYCQGSYYVPAIADWPLITPVLAEIFGEIRPASTAIVCGLVDPRMKIEIEVTARRRTA